MEIVKVYRESVPDVKLIGKRYTNKDRDETGTFAGYWQQWFQEGRFELLKPCERIPGVSDDYLGVMRMTGNGDEFEYWIGAFFTPDSEVPEGFDSIGISAGDIGVCWVYGNEESGELFSQAVSDLAMAAMAEQGWTFTETSWFLERYNHPRYTEPDETGNVILDICAYLA